MARFLSLAPECPKEALLKGEEESIRNLLERNALFYTLLFRASVNAATGMQAAVEWDAAVPR